MTSYGLYLSAAGMKVNDHRQTLLANNLANSETPGFKHDLAVLRERRVESMSGGGFSLAHPVLDGMAGGVNVRPVYHNFGQGRIEQTGRPLDVAIAGDGFFAVSDGEVTRYTRDGRFTMRPDGVVAMAAGGGRWTLLDEGGAPIRLDVTAGSPEIRDDGTVRQGDTVVARIGLKTTGDLQTLRKVGENLFEAHAAMKSVEATLQSESIEASTFDSISGLAQMIEASRAYQMNATMIRIQDDLIGSVVNTVGRVG